MERSTSSRVDAVDPSKCCISLEFYRKLVADFIQQHNYTSAIFWADKLVTLSSDQAQDVYLLAQCYYYAGQYQRAALLLISRKYERSNLYFRCLTAKCLYAAKEYVKALDILDLDNKTVVPGHKVKETNWEPEGVSLNSIGGQIYLLRGKVYEAQMNRIVAAQNYKEALRHDIYCFEAFQLLTQHHMLTRAEEIGLFESLRFEVDCVNGDVDFVKYLYSINIKKYSHVTMTLNPIQFATMRKNLDVLTGDAERLYYNGDFLQCYKLCTKIVNDDPLHLGCLPVYVACLVELKKVTELFKVSHKLLASMPETALVWYAVGSYYFATGKHDVARRHLNKSMCIDPVFGPSWLLFGHSFAQEGEHDQAMAAYFKATQLMKGCHLPLLHVGMECGISNNPQLAMKFLEDALAVAPKDPTIRHEMGVIKFNEKRYTEAHRHFGDALEMIEKPHMKHFLKKWEPLYNNMGHVCRKLKRYNDAYTHHRTALLLKPSMASTHAAIGMLHSITGKMDLAVESFHKALSMQRDDSFSNMMLRQIIDKLVEDSKDDIGNVGIFSDQKDGITETEEEEIDDSDAETICRPTPAP